MISQMWLQMRVWDAETSDLLHGQILSHHQSYSNQQNRSMCEGQGSVRNLVFPHDVSHTAEEVRLEQQKSIERRQRNH